jgi:hypothetical protein
MYQIISSAIGNKPPPDAVVGALNSAASPSLIDKVWVRGGRDVVGKTRYG